MLSDALIATLPFWPLLGSVLVGVVLALRQGRSLADKLVVGGVAVSAALSVLLFYQVGQGAPHATGAPVAHSAPAVPHATGHAAGDGAHADPAQRASAHQIITLYRWISLGEGRFIDFNYLIDPLTTVMLVVVTVIGTMIVIYSIGYMRDHHGHPERGYERFFAFMGLFVFSMCALVLAGNFVLLYLGWEAVGLCSYLLIGFYYHKPAAAAAAKKAFLVNRIGDLGFALGIFALYLYVTPLTQPGENPLDYATVFKYAGRLHELPAVWGLTAADLVCLLLMCGALGKSAQFPLYVWLPDAMEGPTPVSALIHAATMVTAGVYMMARCGPLFAHSPIALNVITVLALIGAIGAATMAMAQYDMKRILAYSTMSQLAYMFVGIGCAAPDSAIFHLYTHAFFKALLFLCAGSVMHAMGGVIDLRRFSGLRIVLPKTYALMLIGCLALAGFPLLAGFWSKDEIIHAAFARSQVVGVLLLITAFMTAYYTFRMFFLCFGGPKRLPDEAGDHPHESPPVMIRPLIVLALGAVAAGFAGVTLAPSGQAFLGFLQPHGYFHHYLESSTVVHGSHHAGGVWMMYLSAAIALAGIGLAYARYGAAPTSEPDRQALGGLWNLWNAKYYVDEIYDQLLVRPLRRLGDFCFATDRNGIDGLVWFVSAVPRGLGAALRLVQAGAVQGYALGMVIGLAVLLLLWRWFETVPTS